MPLCLPSLLACSSPGCMQKCRRSRGTTTLRCSSWPPPWQPQRPSRSSSARLRHQSRAARPCCSPASCLQPPFAATAAWRHRPALPCPPAAHPPPPLACRSVDLENVAIVDSVLQFAQNIGNVSQPGLQPAIEQYRSILAGKQAEAHERLEQVQGYVTAAGRQLEHQRSQVRRPCVRVCRACRGWGRLGLCGRAARAWHRAPGAAAPLAAHRSRHSPGHLAPAARSFARVVPHPAARPHRQPARLLLHPLGADPAGGAGHPLRRRAALGAGAPLSARCVRPPGSCHAMRGALLPCCQHC